MQTDLTQKLQEFGLTDKEARVYMASLELGSATADQISKLAEVNRSTTYVQIEQLMEQGLMSTHEEGKKTMFTAESPDNLKRLYQKRIEELQTEAQELEKIVPDLTRIFDSAGERPVVRYFHGKEGYVTMRNELLKSKAKEFYSLTDFDLMATVLTEEERTMFSEKRGEKNIGGKVLYTKNGPSIEPVPPIEMKRVAKDEAPFESEVYIYNSHVAMASLKGAVAGVIIDSQAIANTMRAIFDLAWSKEEYTGE